MQQCVRDLFVHTWPCGLMVSTIVCTFKLSLLKSLGSIPSGCPACRGLLFSSSWFTKVDGMKCLQCSSTAQLLSTEIWMEGSMVCSTAIRIDMNRRVYGALIQFGYYQHYRYNQGLIDTKALGITDWIEIRPERHHYILEEERMSAYYSCKA